VVADSDKPWYEIPREEWRWKLLIRHLEFVTSEIVEKARQEVIKKKKTELVCSDTHVGQYSAEPESIAKILSRMGFIMRYT